MTNKNELNANERTENMEETNSRKKQRGFTLAETLIALTILGIIAAITVPQLVRRQQEVANRTKFKKAVMSYESVMNKIAIMNDLKSNPAIQEWASNNGANDCGKAYNYFKAVKDLNNDNKCKFKTADGVYWDITDIQKPIVALKENDLTDATAKSDTNRAFYLYAQYDGTGILRVTEPNFNYNLVSANADNVNNSVDRLWAFLNGETSTSQAEVASTSNSVNEPVAGPEPEPVVETPYSFEDEFNKLKNNEFNNTCENPDSNTNCTNCSSCKTSAGYVYDSKGNLISSPGPCDGYVTVYDEGGNSTYYSTSTWSIRSGKILCEPEESL